MLAKLNKLLSNCRLTKDDPILKALAEADESYLIQRASEEVALSRSKDLTPEQRDDRRRLSIQLLNLARYRALTPSAPNSPSATVRKRRSKTPSSPNS